MLWSRIRCEQIALKHLFKNVCSKKGRICLEFFRLFLPGFQPIRLKVNVKWKSPRMDWTRHRETAKKKTEQKYGENLFPALHFCKRLGWSVVLVVTARYFWNCSIEHLLYSAQNRPQKGSWNYGHGASLSPRPCFIRHASFRFWFGRHFFTLNGTHSQSQEVSLAGMVGWFVCSA